jgi:hypothetical protein
MTMKILTVHRWIVLAPLALVLLAAVALASAATTSAQTNPCQDQFAELRAATQFAPITGVKSEKERAGLVKIIDDAEALAAGGKISDAVTKLRNFTVKVDQLEAAGRISADGADTLRSDAQAAIACLEGSITSTA